MREVKDLKAESSGLLPSYYYPNVVTAAAQSYYIAIKNAIFLR